MKSHNSAEELFKHYEVFHEPGDQPSPFSPGRWDSVLLNPSCSLSCQENSVALSDNLAILRFRLQLILKWNILWIKKYRNKELVILFLLWPFFFGITFSNTLFQRNIMYCDMLFQRKVEYENIWQVYNKSMCLFLLREDLVLLRQEVQDLQASLKVFCLWVPPFLSALVCLNCALLIALLLNDVISLWICRFSLKLLMCIFLCVFSGGTLVFWGIEKRIRQSTRTTGN